MAQHDYVIANGTGAAVRSDLNNALAAIVSQNSGAVAPTTTYAYMPWADTGSSPPVFKIRNAANNGWITLYELDGTFSIEAGSASSPGLYFTGDTNTGIYSPGADQFGIATGGTSRLVIDASGNINMDSGTVYVDAVNNRAGFGTTSPAVNLHVKDSTTGRIRIEGGSTYAAQLQFLPDAQTNPWVITCDSSRNLVFFDHASERGRWDSSGRFLVGTSSAVTGGNTQYGKLQILGNTAGSTSDGRVIIGRGESVTSSGTGIGQICFTDSTAGEFANIKCEADAASGSSDYPGRLMFSTCPDSSATPVERMRITNQGRTFINKTTTSSTNSPGLEIQAPNTNLAEFALEIRDSTGADIIIGCSNGNYLRSTTVYGRTSAAAANVIIDPGGYIYRSTSSIKYKTDIETLDDSYADALLNCRPVWYRSTSERDNPQWGHWGFIAEEVAEIDPRLCFFSEKEDGSLEPEGVQYDRFVPHLLNLIKRQKEQIEAQGTAIAALEARLSALEAS